MSLRMEIKKMLFVLQLPLLLILIMKDFFFERIDDCLGFIRMIFMDFYLHKYTKICTYMILLFHVPLWATQFYQYFTTFDIYLLIQYESCSLVFVYIFMSMMLPLVFEKHMGNWFATKRKLFWSLRTASNKVQKAILREAACINLTLKINVLLAVASYVLLLVRANLREEWEIMYQVTFFKENFPEKARIFVPIFYASLCYFIIPMILFVYVFAYFVLHISFQGKMVIERITKITAGFPSSVELGSDDAYQRQVAERMRFCVVRCGALKRFAEVYLRYCKHLIVLYSILGMLLMFSYIGLWYLDNNKFYPLFIIFSITSCFSGIVVVEIGQLVEDESSKIYTSLTNLPWYTFNVKNQKTLLFFLIHAVIPITVSPFENFPVNRRIIVKFYKIFSSASALLASSKEKVFSNNVVEPKVQ